MWLGLLVWVVFRVLSQSLFVSIRNLFDRVTYLENDEVINWHGTSSNSLAERRQVIVDVADHVFRRFTGKNFLQDCAIFVSLNL